MPHLKLNRATNSSSTHSIIIVPPDDPPYCNVSPYYPNEYGWDKFVLADPQSKLEYLATALYLTLDNILSKELSLSTINSYLNIDLPPNAYIDHQSAFTLPSDWDGRAVDISFLQDFITFLTRDDVVILGGNDNTDEDFPCHENIIPMDDFTHTCIARKDGDHWTLFNRKTGSRLTFSFTHPDTPLLKADVPMLVEINMTDRCQRACSYCYRDATPTGKHAAPEDLSNLAYDLSRLKVFEVCFGGGEPTEHPALSTTLETYTKYGINTNFTTRNLTWSPSLIQTVKECNTGVGYTVEDLHEAKAVLKAFEGWGLTRQLTFHIVDRLIRPDQFRFVAQLAHLYSIPILVMGYKPLGRGQYFKPYYEPLWPTITSLLKSHHRIALDTSMTAAYQPALDSLKVPRACYTTREGKFNCFIDMVNGYMSESSYSGERYPFTSKEFQTIWAKL